MDSFPERKTDFLTFWSLFAVRFPLSPAPLTVDFGSFEKIGADGLPWVLALITYRAQRGFSTTVILPHRNPQHLKLLNDVGLGSLLFRSPLGDHCVDRFVSLPQRQLLTSEPRRHKGGGTVIGRLHLAQRVNDWDVQEAVRELMPSSSLTGVRVDNLAGIVGELHANGTRHVAEPGHGDGFVLLRTKAKQKASISYSDSGNGILSTLRLKPLVSGDADDEREGLLALPQSDREALRCALTFRAINHGDKKYGLIGLCRAVLALGGRLVLVSGDCHFQTKVSDDQARRLAEDIPGFAATPDRFERMKGAEKWLASVGEYRGNPPVVGVHISIEVPW